MTLDKSKETKGNYSFDSPHPNTPITSVYVKKSAFEGGSVPERIMLTVQEA